MDAYAFAATATSAALAELAALVEDGRLRVAAPLAGAYAAYVAVAADSEDDLLDGLSRLRSVDGIGGLEALLAVRTDESPPGRTTPTWGVVGNMVVFALVRARKVAKVAVRRELLALPGLVGLAEVRSAEAEPAGADGERAGDAVVLLAELTGPDEQALAPAVDGIGGIVGVESVVTSRADVARGTGFRTS